MCSLIIGPDADFHEVYNTVYRFHRKIPEMKIFIYLMTIFLMIVSFNVFQGTNRNEWTLISYFEKINDYGMIWHDMIINHFLSFHYTNENMISPKW